MPTRDVVLTEHQEELLERLVSSGRYANADEVLREGLRLVESREAEQKAKREAFRAAVQEGLDDIAAGRYKEFNSFEDLDTYLDAVATAAIEGKRI